MDKPAELNPDSPQAVLRDVLSKNPKSVIVTAMFDNETTCFISTRSPAEFTLLAKITELALDREVEKRLGIS